MKIHMNITDCIGDEISMQLKAARFYLKTNKLASGIQALIERKVPLQSLRNHAKAGDSYKLTASAFVKGDNHYPYGKETVICIPIVSGDIRSGFSNMAETTWDDPQGVPPILIEGLLNLASANILGEIYPTNVTTLIKSGLLYRSSGDYVLPGSEELPRSGEYYIKKVACFQGGLRAPDNTGVILKGFAGGIEQVIEPGGSKLIYYSIQEGDYRLLDEKLVRENAILQGQELEEVISKIHASAFCSER